MNVPLSAEVGLGTLELETPVESTGVERAPVPRVEIIGSQKDHGSIEEASDCEGTTELCPLTVACTLDALAAVAAVAPFCPAVDVAGGVCHGVLPAAVNKRLALCVPDAGTNINDSVPLGSNVAIRLDNWLISLESKPGAIIVGAVEASPVPDAAVVPAAPALLLVFS